MKYFVMFLILIGLLAGTAFGNNAPNDINLTPEQICSSPICFIEDENEEKPTRGSDFIIKAQVEPETKFTARIFDPDYMEIFNESDFSDKDGIARLAHSIPHDAKGGDYEVTVTSYPNKGAVHTGMLLRMDFLDEEQTEAKLVTHVHFDHGVGTSAPIAINKPIDMRIITTDRFVNNTNHPLEFTIFDPDGKIIGKGAVLTEKEHGAAHHSFVSEKYGKHTVIVKSKLDGILEHSEAFAVSKSQHIIRDGNRDFPVGIGPLSEPTIAVNNVEFDKDARQLTLEMEPT